MLPENDSNSLIKQVQNSEVGSQKIIKFQFKSINYLGHIHIQSDISTWYTIEVMFWGAFLCLLVFVITPEVMNRSFLKIFTWVGPRERKRCLKLGKIQAIFWTQKESENFQKYHCQLVIKVVLAFWCTLLQKY